MTDLPFYTTRAVHRGWQAIRQLDEKTVQVIHEYHGPFARLRAAWCAFSMAKYGPRD